MKMITLDERPDSLRDLRPRVSVDPEVAARRGWRFRAVWGPTTNGGHLLSGPTGGCAPRVPGHTPRSMRRFPSPARRLPARAVVTVTAPRHLRRDLDEKVSSGPPISRDLACIVAGGTFYVQSPGPAPPPPRHLGRRHRHCPGQDGDVHGTRRVRGLRRWSRVCRVLSRMRGERLALAVSRPDTFPAAFPCSGGLPAPGPTPQKKPEVIEATATFTGSGRRRAPDLAAVAASTRGVPATFPRSASLAAEPAGPAAARLITRHEAPRRQLLCSKPALFSAAPQSRRRRHRPTGTCASDHTPGRRRRRSV